MMGTCPVDGCGTETIQVNDPRCTKCIHEGRDYDEEKTGQKQAGLSAFSNGEEVRTDGD